MHSTKCILCQSGRKSGCRLFRFPARGTPMWHRWLEACSLTDASIKSGALPRLCHLHFQPKDFLTRQLTRMAVPSLFPVTVITEVENSGGAEFNNGEQEPEYGEIERLEDEEEVVEQVDLCAEENLDSLMEYGEAVSAGLLETDFDDDDDSEPVLVEDLIEETTSEIAEGSCSVAEHANLLKRLEQQRSKVDFLQKELAERGKIIARQYKLLSELGVEVVTFAD